MRPLPAVKLYATTRLFVNFFQPSFKLAEKEREGAKVRKRYHPPATPLQRLLADPRVSGEINRRQRSERDDVYREMAARHPDAPIIVPPRSTAVPSSTAETAPKPGGDN